MKWLTSYEWLPVMGVFANELARWLRLARL